MLIHNDKRLNTDSNFWLLGNCDEGGGINELPASLKQHHLNINLYLCKKE